MAGAVHETSQRLRKRPWFKHTEHTTLTSALCSPTPISPQHTSYTPARRRLDKRTHATTKNKKKKPNTSFFFLVSSHELIRARLVSLVLSPPSSANASSSSDLFPVTDTHTSGLQDEVAMRPKKLEGRERRAWAVPRLPPNSSASPLLWLPLPSLPHVVPSSSSSCLAMGPAAESHGHVGASLRLCVRVFRGRALCTSLFSMTARTRRRRSSDTSAHPFCSFALTTPQRPLEHCSFPPQPISFPSQVLISRTSSPAFLLPFPVLDSLIFCCVSLSPIFSALFHAARARDFAPPPRCPAGLARLLGRALGVLCSLVRATREKKRNARGASLVLSHHQTTDLRSPVSAVCVSLSPFSFLLTPSPCTHQCADEWACTGACLCHGAPCGFVAAVWLLVLCFVHACPPLRGGGAGTHAQLSLLSLSAPFLFLP